MADDKKKTVDYEPKIDPWFERALWLNHGIHGADWASTMYALNGPYSGQFTEGNPVARMWADKPALAVPIEIALGYAQHKLFEEIYKKSKTAAWASLVPMMLFHGYVLSKNLDQINKAKNR